MQLDRKIVADCQRSRCRHGLTIKIQLGVKLTGQSTERFAKTSKNPSTHQVHDPPPPILDRRELLCLPLGMRSLDRTGAVDTVQSASVHQLLLPVLTSLIRVHLELTQGQIVPDAYALLELRPTARGLALTDWRMVSRVSSLSTSS